jgi:hypothetical protein
MKVFRLRVGFVGPILTGLLLAGPSSGCSGTADGQDASRDGAADRAPPFDTTADRATPEVSPVDAVTPPSGEDAQALADTADVPMPSDAASTDAGAVTYVAHIQPILRTTCNGCHNTGSYAPFVDSYAATQVLSTASNSYGCPGELVGVCINRAAQIQMVEGSHCRTFDRPFHRDGFNRCITEDERALIMAWVAGGMLER